MSFEDPGANDRGFSKLMTPSTVEHIALADLEFEEDVGTKHASLNTRTTVNFGVKGFCLFIPIKVSKEVEDSESDGKTDEPGQVKFYRIAFHVPVKEVETARHALLPKNLNHDLLDEVYGHTPVYRDGYEANSEAINYLQGKIDVGVRHIAEPGSNELPISPSDGTIPHVKNIIWSSTFRVRYALADAFYKHYPLGLDDSSPDGGHILLVGDAAHVHSPTGGQGMNLGIRDGLECGKAIIEHWKDAHILSSSDPNEILRRYSTARLKEAKQIIEITKRMSWLATMTGGFKVTLRNWGLWLIGRFKFSRRKFAMTISGVGA